MTSSSRPAPFVGGPLDGEVATSDRPVFRHADGVAARADDRWRPGENSIYVRTGPPDDRVYRWITTPAPTGRPAPVPANRKER